MKKHIISIVLLLLASVAFLLRFCVDEMYWCYCNIAAFALPTIAAIIEIVVSERIRKETEIQIKKLKDNQLSVCVEDGTLKILKGEDASVN